MSVVTPVEESADVSADLSVAVDRATHRRRATFLFVFAAWNVFVWGTRMRNLVGDGEEHTAAFIAVHVVLYLAGFGGAAALTMMGIRMRREAALPGQGADA